MRRKTVASILSGIFVICILFGCSPLKKAEVKNPTVNDIKVKIKDSVDISTMKEADAAKLKKLYNISSDEVEEFVLLTAPSNIKADEIAIIKLKDSKSISDIKDKISKRIDAQATRFKDYLPDEYFIIQKNIVKVKGNYILFVISKDEVKISDIFDECFK